MPPKKAAPNGFYMYMREKQSEIKKQTKRAPTMKEMPSICREAWNSMSADERQRYDDQAKRAKHQTSHDNEYARKDNQRQYIMDRKDPVKENERRRLQENQKMRTNWRGQDLLNIKFHIINFQVMFTDWTTEVRLPMEIGVVCITMKDGMVKNMHRFINPGEAPEGFRSMAMAHSEATHQIPIQFEHGDQNWKGLWKQIEEFLCDDPSSDDEVPPLFCLSSEREDTERCLEWLYYKTGRREVNRVNKVYCLEDMAASLLTLAKPGSPEPSKTQLLDIMQQNRWDYRSDIRCSYHEENDCAYCSISKVRRYSFSMFDTLSGALNFKLTGDHLPDETETVNTVYHHPTFIKDLHSQDEDIRGASRGVSGMSLGSSMSRPPAPAPVTNAWTRPCPTVDRVEIQLSDDEAGPCTRSIDTDSDEDDVLHTEEIKSTVDHYHLKELRLPKSVSMVQSAAKAQADAYGDAGLGKEAATPAASLIPTNRGLLMNTQPVLAMGRGRGLSPGLPEGLRPPPGLPAPSMAKLQDPAPAWGRPSARPPPPSLWSQSQISSGAPSLSSGAPSVCSDGPEDFPGLGSQDFPGLGSNFPGLPPRTSGLGVGGAAGTGVAMGRGVLIGRGRAPLSAGAMAAPGGRSVPMGRGQGLPMGRGRGIPMGRGLSSGN